jgi:hypothetical protein
MGGHEVEVDIDEFAAAGPDQRKKLREYAGRLSVDPLLGDRIPRDRVPREFRRLPVLFRLELPGAWRALYTVATRPGRASLIRIVWIGSHKRYDRLFGYS